MYAAITFVFLVNVYLREVSSMPPMCRQVPRENQNDDSPSALLHPGVAGGHLGRLSLAARSDGAGVLPPTSQRPEGVFALHVDRSVDCAGHTCPGNTD